MNISCRFSNILTPLLTLIVFVYFYYIERLCCSILRVLFNARLWYPKIIEGFFFSTMAINRVFSILHDTSKIIRLLYYKGGKQASQKLSLPYSPKNEKLLENNIILL